MTPQSAGYKAIYNKKYMFWVGPLNFNKDKRISHERLDNPTLVSFSDVAQQKQVRDSKKNEAFLAINQKNQAQIEELEASYRQIIQIRNQEQEINILKQKINGLLNTSSTPSASGGASQ